MADWDTVRGIATSLPDAEESTSYGRPAFKVRRRLFAWISPDDAAGGALATYVEEAEKQLLIDSNPRLYFSKPHYASYPIVLMRLDRASRTALHERIEDSWLLRAPKKLVDAYVAGAG